MSLNYGRVTSAALDPIEKKPLARFYPGSMILSVGSFGCNLNCPFCQNYEIAGAGEDFPSESVTPHRLAELAEGLKTRGNIGLAYTYNEPLVGWEFVRDCAIEIRARGMKNVLVTNGTAEPEIQRELLPLIDAYNIDLKGFTEEWYKKLGGDLETVKRFIAAAAGAAHVELTTLIVPGENDGEDDLVVGRVSRPQNSAARHALLPAAAHDAQAADAEGDALPPRGNRAREARNCNGGKRVENIGA